MIVEPVMATNKERRSSFEEHGGGKLICNNCFGHMVDKIMLGNIIRPLFMKGDAQQIKDGLINFVTSAGVVSALFISISSGQAFSVEAIDWVSTINVLCWYISTWLSMWSVVVSTLLGVLLSITPEDNLRKVGQKMLYLWVCPAWLMLWSSFCLVTAIWSSAEMGYREAVDSGSSMNSTSTSTRNEEHEFIVMWFARAFYGATVLATAVAFLILMCCSGTMEKYLGIESVHVDTSSSSGGRTWLKNKSVGLESVGTTKQLKEGTTNNNNEEAKE